MFKEEVILLNDIESVREFVESAIFFLGDIQLIQGEHKADGKSILNIVSFDLKEPLKIRVIHDNVQEINAFMGKISKYLITEKEK